MSLLDASFSQNLSGLDAIERNLMPRLGNALNDAADAFIADIRDNWSDSSPSSPNTAPAVDSGNLDSAIFKDPSGRDVLGRFTSRDNAQVVFVRVDTTQGQYYHGRGAYEDFVEEGTSSMEPRPYWEPAVERAQAVYTSFFVNIFGIGGMDE